jgi:hypothetical protein
MTINQIKQQLGVSVLHFSPCYNLEKELTGWEKSWINDSRTMISATTETLNKITPEFDQLIMTSEVKHPVDKEQYTQVILFVSEEPIRTL